MACCGLCRPKIKSSIKTKNTITRKKVNKIDRWMENIEGSYEPIILPSKSPDKPKKITNKEEIAEAERNDHLSDTSEQSEISENDTGIIDQNMQNGRQNLQYLSSELSMSDDRQSATSKSDSVHQP
jgi:hypothetical protein